MKGWKMYSKIHQLKADGLKKSQVSRKLGLNYKTISKYWTMSPSEYQAYQEKSNTRKKKLEKGFKPKDALHVSCAKYAKCDYFFTTDNGILKKTIDGLMIMNPISFIELEEDYH